MDDDDTRVRLTYAELARARGITKGAAKRMSVRHKWPKQVGNDGLSRVMVPASYLVRDTGDTPGADPGVASGDDPVANTSADPGAVQGVRLDEFTVVALADALASAVSVASADASAEIVRAVRTLEQALQALQGQLAAERERANRAEERARLAEERLQEERVDREQERNDHRKVIETLAARIPARKPWWRRQ